MTEYTHRLHFIFDKLYTFLLVFSFLSLSQLACQEDLPDPQLSSVSPTFQQPEEGITVSIHGKNFFPEIKRQATGKQEFKANKDFVVRFSSSSEGNIITFELKDVRLIGREELIGVTSEVAPPGSYSVIVESPLGTTSNTLEAAFDVLHHENENRDSSDDTEDSEDLSEDDTESSADSDADADSAPLEDTDDTEHLDDEDDTDAENHTDSAINTDTSDQSTEQTTTDTGSPSEIDIENRQGDNDSDKTIESDTINYSTDAQELCADGSSPGMDGCVEPTCNTGELLGPNWSCYYFSTVSQTQEYARSTCQMRGSDWDLASVKTEEVNAFIKENIWSDAWIGGSDASQPDYWIWLRDGEPFWSGDVNGSPVNDAYSDWIEGEPSDGANDERCLRLTQDTDSGGRGSDGRDSGGWDSNSGSSDEWGWADTACDRSFYAVCEGPAQDNTSPF